MKQPRSGAANPSIIKTDSNDEQFNDAVYKVKNNYGIFSAWWLPNFCGGGAFLNGGYDPPYWGYYGFAFAHNYDNNHFWINPNRSAMKLRRNPPT